MVEVPVVTSIGYGRLAWTHESLTFKVDGSGLVLDEWPYIYAGRGRR